MYRIFVLLSLWIITSCDDSIEREPPIVDYYDLYEHLVLPQETDSKIATSAESHHAYINVRASSRGKLLVFLSGTDSYPKHYTYFSKTAAELGYHVINVNYLNGESVKRCYDATDEDCFAKFHEEVLFGTAVCDFVNVDSANSIYNRIVKLLTYLQLKNPKQGWDQFSNAGTIDYGKLVLAGHSQGGGHAAYFAQKFSIDRLIVFAAPNDYSEKYDRPAPWCESAFATSPIKIFGLLHKHDEIVSPAYQYAIWNSMGLLSPSDTISVEGTKFKTSRALVTDFDPNPNAKPRLKHNLPVRDDALPSAGEGSQLMYVWKYLLGG